MLIRKLVASLLVVAPLIAGVRAANASFVYTYSGNSFTVGTPGSVSGEFTLATALGNNFNGAVTPTQFSFFGGPLTLSSSSSPTYVFDIKTSNTGAILAWSISISNALGSISTSNSVDSFNFGYIFGSDHLNPGKWTASGAPSATPLPASWTMMLGILVMGLGFVSYQKLKRENGSSVIAQA